MRISPIISAIASVLVLASAGRADVITGVVNVSAAGAISTDNAVFSTAGHTVWNPGHVYSGPPGILSDLKTEDGIFTHSYVKLNSAVNSVSSATSSAFGSVGVLRSSTGTGTIEFADLLSGGTYDLAIYAGENSNFDFFIGNDTFKVTDAGGSVTKTTTATPVVGLPGTENREYLRFDGLTPFDIGGGVLGIRIQFVDSNSSYTGLQLRGAFTPIPEPGTTAFMAAVALLGLRSRVAKRRMRQGAI